MIWRWRDHGPDRRYQALPGPLLLTWTLMKWSGAPTVEGKLHKTRPGYAEYIARTSGFIPLPLRRDRG